LFRLLARWKRYAGGGEIGRQLPVGVAGLFERTDARLAIAQTRVYQPNAARGGRDPLAEPFVVALLARELLIVTQNFVEQSHLLWGEGCPRVE
jgi:hypothetical protein